MKWIEVKTSDNGFVRLQHSGLTRLEAVRFVLAIARTIFFRWDEFQPYREWTTTGFGYSRDVKP
jgi:hypothetical protein